MFTIGNLVISTALGIVRCAESFRPFEGRVAVVMVVPIFATKDVAVEGTFASPRPSDLTTSSGSAKVLLGWNLGIAVAGNVRLTTVTAKTIE